MQVAVLNVFAEESLKLQRAAESSAVWSREVGALPCQPWTLHTMVEAVGASDSALAGLDSARRRHSLSLAVAGEVDIDIESGHFRCHSDVADAVKCGLMSCWNDDCRLTLRLVASSTLPISDY